MQALFAKAWDAVSAPFRSWDTIVDLCTGVVATTVGVVVFLLATPLALLVGLAVGAAVLGDTLLRYARGTAGLGDVAWAALVKLPGAVVQGVVVLGRGVATEVARPVRDGGRAVDRPPADAAVSLALQDLRDQAAVLPGGNLTWGTGDFLRWQAHIGESKKEFKLRWIRDNREVIKAAADHYGISAGLLAGIAYLEVGGKPMILDEAADLVRRNYPDSIIGGTRLGGVPDKTSYGPMAVQVRRAAETLGYDPNNLSEQQRSELVVSLGNSKESVFIAAHHLSDLKQPVDFALTDPGPMTAEQERELAARYNGGPFWQGARAQGYAKNYAAHRAEAAEALR